MDLSLPDRAERVLEPGQNVFASQRIRLVEDGFGSVGATQARDHANGIHDPHDASSTSQPVANLREHLAGPIIRRQNLHDETRHKLGKSTRRRVWQTRCADERDVWSAHGVRVPTEGEPCFRPPHHNTPPHMDIPSDRSWRQSTM
jgi:hypothetical protein